MSSTPRRQKEPVGAESQAAQTELAGKQQTAARTDTQTKLAQWGVAQRAAAKEALTQVPEPERDLWCESPLVF